MASGAQTQPPAERPVSQPKPPRHAACRSLQTKAAWGLDTLDTSDTVAETYPRGYDHASHAPILRFVGGAYSRTKPRSQCPSHTHRMRATRRTTASGAGRWTDAAHPGPGLDQESARSGKWREHPDPETDTIPVCRARQELRPDMPDSRIRGNS